MLRLTCSAHQRTLDLVNQHAKIVASKCNEVNEAFRQKFARFIELLKNSDYDNTYLDGSATDLTWAYWKFFESVRTDVTGVAG